MAERHDWLEHRMQGLTDTPHGSSWPSAAELRQRATRRRRRRLAGISGGTTVAVAVALVVSLLLIPGTGHGPAGTRPSVAAGAIRRLPGPDGSVHLVADVSSKAPATSPKAEASTVAAEQAFALALTKQLAATEGAGNTLLSPMSVDIDLAMMELGSAGATEREIATALQSSALPAAEQAAGWRLLVRSLLGGASAGELKAANSIWIDSGQKVEAAYLRAAATNFGDDTYQVNFANATAASKSINAWVSQETARRITQLVSPSQLSAATELVLANAVHFHAPWAKNVLSSLGAGSVGPETFHTAAGAEVSVPTIEDVQADLAQAKTPAYDAIQLPYSNGRYAALLIEPLTGSMSSFLGSLTPSTLSRIAASLRQAELNLQMPELSLSSRSDLRPALSKMGMAQVFENADFSPMFGAALGTSNQACSFVEHAATLHLNRWGTDAAAATASGIEASSAPAEQISFDHPYLLFIRDTHTGAILFSSVVNNPAAG